MDVVSLVGTCCNCEPMKGYREFSTHFAEMDFFNFKIEKAIYVTSQIV